MVDLPIKNVFFYSYAAYAGLPEGTAHPFKVANGVCHGIPATFPLQF